MTFTPRTNKKINRFVEMNIVERGDLFLEAKKRFETEGQQ